MAMETITVTSAMVFTSYWSQVSERWQCKDTTPEPFSHQDPFQRKTLRVRGEVFVSFGLLSVYSIWHRICLQFLLKMKEGGLDRGPIALARVLLMSLVFEQQRPSLGMPDLRATLMAKKRDSRAGKGERRGKIPATSSFLCSLLCV